MENIDLIGRLVQPAQCRDLPHGQVANLRLACNRGQSDQNGNLYTDYHDVTLWGKSAQIAGKYTAVGSLISIVGQLENSNYTKNGKKYNREYIFGQRIGLLETKQQTLKHKAAANDNIATTNDYQPKSSTAQMTRDQPISNTDDSKSFPF